MSKIIVNCLEMMQYGFFNIIWMGDFDMQLQ